ncbi:MAG: ral secretion pathway protein [Candidatus Sumerlaeota bacterium]|nr:ral secretion pathway protein [Candidatus Sumerlaeota bacterium]
MGRRGTTVYTILAGGMLAVLLALPAALPADRLFLNNGSVLEGTIVFEDGAEVRILVGGSELAITRDRISRVENTEDVVGPGESEATTSRQALKDGRIADAWQALLQMHQADPDAWRRHESHVKNVIKEMLDAIDSSIARGDAASALALADALASPESSALVFAVYPDSQTSVANRLRLARGGAHASAGRVARQQGNLEFAEQELRQALEFLKPDDLAFAPAQYELGGVLKQKGLALNQAGNKQAAATAFSAALQAYEQVRQTAQRDAAMLRTATSEIQSIREGLLKPLNAQLNVTPTPVPVTVVQRTPFPSPTPVPTPTPQPGLTERVFGAGAREKVSGFFNKLLPESIDGGKVADWTLYAILFIVGFWVIPGLILRMLTKRLDPVAQTWLGRVLYLGPIALAGYAVSFIKMPTKKARTKKAKHPCPHCGFALDNVLVYESLDFRHCPNCGGDIAPIYTLEDYINLVSNSLATDAEKVVMGLVTMESFVGKDMMQRLVRAMIIKAVRDRASDVHVEPQQDHVTVRYRVDGMMLEMTRLPASLGPAVVSAVKVTADMDISEKRKPQDGRTQYEVDGANIDVRVASSPSPQGEKLSMRLLDFRSIETDAKKLGMTKSTRDLFDRSIHEPHGLVLVCGPTGSGKTTTLYVALRSLATGDKNIVSIEDPIEFRLAGINQTQVNPVAGLTFANGLRSILRQDPDVVMVGEIRDKETAEIAVNAAQTGHLVFSTLHTIDAASSITRLYDFGIGPRQFADALSIVMAQRLIRLVCPECKKQTKPDSEILKAIGIPVVEEDQYPWVVGKGCDVCNKTGFLGRTGLFEMLVPNTAIRTALERGDITTAELRELAIANGMRTLREESLVLLRQSMTTAEEVLRVTK